MLVMAMNVLFRTQSQPGFVSIYLHERHHVSSLTSKIEVVVMSS